MGTMIIQQRIEDMIDYGTGLIQRWPKLFRYTLGERVMNQMYQIAELCEAANRKYYKKTTMQEIDVKLAQLQSMVRRASRTALQTDRRKTLLSQHQYEVWSKMIVEAGKMLGGWIKALNGRKEQPNRAPDMPTA